VEREFQGPHESDAATENVASINPSAASWNALHVNRLDRGGAGLEHRGLYSLRHTFATWAIAEGMNTFHLSRVMATSVEMIDKHYGHLLRDADEAVLSAMNRFDGRQVDANEKEETG
jgi:integrase